MKYRYILYFATVFLLLSACSSQPAGEQVSSFSFTDQNGRSFDSDYLAGSVWIASFIFTNCETVCPPMMFEMAALQDELENSEVKAEIVIFTVDPEVDSPEVLKQYVQQFTDEEANWHMLTGYSQETIEDFARENFQSMVQKPEKSNQVIHGTNFYLVDEKGYVLHEYNYIDDAYVDEMLEDIKDR